MDDPSQLPYIFDAVKQYCYHSRTLAHAHLESRPTSWAHVCTRMCTRIYHAFIDFYTSYYSRHTISCESTVNKHSIS